MPVASEPLSLSTAAPANPPLADDPLWYKDAVIYQAHVKSFLDSTADGIGDFQGLTQKLDYIQGLGTTCIWLLPFFPSPLKDDGYDISDYLNVHPSYGTLDDFKRFVGAAHDRGIRVVIELVVNHTSDQHPWFERARRAPAGSPERNFYVWSDTDEKFPETRIIFSDTEKSNWAFDPVAKQYYWHRFFSHQPDLNHNNPEVVDAIIDVMRFWLDLGVDGFRLDAVPYLCVREGTNNESLPETHAVLRRIRRELDRHYKNRMLLAEANQWPADVRPYFGNGDECHMAFHFPLMPRMFMALRQEDRHAITEILMQTPEIPETCQWALFLRNHDELTLEMVTDEERDYMYQVYASDPRARLNAGIRRRLAPLVENSRRRIELLNSLLFSLPGTPIIYYGDEIGMGDNIYLGDRNGMRTPMQWTSDKNAGFSRADPARLFAPPVMDPVYGYQSINVEAQERYPFSLLNWMKRLVAMRRQHRVFGRGSLEFVGCSNRKILAFLRKDEHETILVVANLARTVQPAELDLSHLSGLFPIEMVGQTEFPRITDRPYFLTLGPHASYWFVVQQAPMAVATPTARALATEAPPDVVDSLPSLIVGGNWTNILDAATRQLIERALRAFLKGQHWFSQGEVQEARFSDWLLVRNGVNPAFLTTVAVTARDGREENYALPLAFLSGEDADRAIKETPGCIVARLTGARKGVIVDGFLDNDVCDRLLALLKQPEGTATLHGNLTGLTIDSALLANLTGSADRKWTRGRSGQNDVAFSGDQFVLKLYRRLESGPDPDFEVSRFLTEHHFARSPKLAAGLIYNQPDAPAVTDATLATVQAFIHHQGSAWDFAMSELGHYFERVAARIRRQEETPLLFDAEGGPPPFFLGLQQWFMSSMKTLGQRTADLHRALANGGGDAFLPEPYSPDARQRLVDGVHQKSARLLDALASARDSLNESARADADRLLDSRTALLGQIGDLVHLEKAGVRMRIHGDYHLGRLLRTEEDFVILDFGGDPRESMQERRRKRSPLRDIASLIRSLDYAANAALFAFTVHAPADYAQLEVWADTWQHWSAEAFLDGYYAGMNEMDLVPDRTTAQPLLHVMLVDKALDELAHELRDRPDWVRMPLRGLLKLL